jgi:hypothetical protein
MKITAFLFLAIIFVSGSSQTQLFEKIERLKTFIKGGE